MQLKNILLFRRQIIKLLGLSSASLIVPPANSLIVNKKSSQVSSFSSSSPLGKEELCYLSATEALTLFKQRKLSPVELMTAVIQRSQQIEPLVNAYTDVFYERALEAAKAAETKYTQTTSLRPLEGIPIAIKDLHAIQNERTTYGSKVLVDNRDTFTVPTVARLLQAGAILIARTTTPELGAAAVTHSPLWGITRNPWNLQFNPGGSSGGSAVALAAGMTTLADGSDYGGSLRIPASCCGVVGYKPPFGRNPSDAPYNLDVFNHYGVMGRTVADVALMQNLISGHWTYDIMSLRESITIPQAFADIKGWKIAYSRNLGYFEIDPEVERNTEKALEIFRSLGCQVEEVELGWTSECLGAWMIHASAGFSATVEQIPVNLHSQFSDYVKAFLESGKQLSALELLATHQVRAKMYERLAPILERYNVLLCPTTAIAGVKADHSPLDPNFRINGKLVQATVQWALTYPFNLLSQCPVMSVPSGFASSGVPTGLQIIGKTFDDLSVLQAAAAFERVQPWLNNPNNRPQF